MYRAKRPQFVHVSVTCDRGGGGQHEGSRSIDPEHDGQLKAVPPELRGAAFKAGATLNQRNRCPGAADHPADDKTNPWKPTPDFNCDETEVLPGG